MRAVLQRVKRASVRANGVETGAIGEGYVALIGIERGDGPADLDYICHKIAGLRLWPDEAGKMNRPLEGRAVLAVSQFTLLGDARRGLRPSFDRAAPPAEAEPLYELLVARLRAGGITVATGVFRADMEVELVNLGPVTIWLDSRGS